MYSPRSEFLKALSKETTARIPLYCTGYPELEFIDNFIKRYKLKTNNTNLVLNNKNYGIIEHMGFDVISLWDFRRGAGGYNLDDQRRVDGWGRIYKDDWYLWDGIFKNEKILLEWEYLKLPPKDKILNLEKFLRRDKNKLDYVVSLPGLFEKTWQSMGFYYFAKSLKKNIEFVENVVSFFSNYIKKLISLLQNTGVKTLLVADDYGYKNRTFIPKDLWNHLYFKHYKEIIDIIHEKKIKIIIHSDGYISEMIKIFIDLGFDAVQSLEPNAGVNIFALFKKYQNNICFIGNVDISLLAFGTLQQVKDYVNSLISKANKYNCSLVVSPTQQINTKCKPENVNGMIETTKIFK